MGFFKTWVSDSPVDIRRRSFIFGASAAAAIIVAPKSFFIMPAPKLVVPDSVGPLVFDLPPYWAGELLRKLNEKVIEVSAIPRWVVGNKEIYDALVASEEEQKRRIKQILDAKPPGSLPPLPRHTSWTMS